MKGASSFLLFPLFSSFLLPSCSCRRGGDDVHTEVRLAAQTYYNYVKEGKCDSFALALDVQLPPDLPEACTTDYRRQVADATRQYVEIEKRRHGQMTSIEAEADSLSADGNEAIVTLLLDYEDGAKQRVVVPLRRSAGKWLMR
ncbi:MAG: hypothetical protein KBT12_03300 [Bacteroidales bacterium]|nr:hypothetical protein [Candidatus Physcousia equi]